MFSRGKTKRGRARGFRGLFVRAGGNSRARKGRFPSGLVLRVAAVLACLWLARSLLSVCFFGGRFLWKTIPGPTVARIEVHAGETITAPLLRDYLQIEEGMPLFDRSRSLLGVLFSCDIRAKRRRLLEKAPTLASATITRRMPDTLIVSVTERVPVARLDSYPLVVDRDGVLFVRRRGIEGLPSIRGGKPSPARLGMKFAAGRLADAALELIDCLSSGECAISPVDLDSVDISRPDYIECVFTDRRRAKLAWNEMGEGTPYGRRCLVAQLNGLSDSMKSPRARGRFRFDVTIPGHCFAN